ncbi:site-specific DNA-methyltransferase, partial [bacterium]|nr:site-specific DNA-methyltransferase [bacterium]
VNCVVTSPPYWGLRDYGTAKWVGGDNECDHSSAKEKSRYDYSLKNSHIQDGARTGTDASRWKDVCPKCGAKKVDDQLGLEKTPEEYVQKLVDIFREVKRVLRKDGTVWLNLGDSYSQTRWSDTPSTTGISKEHSDIVSERITNLKPKNLVGIPWRVAFALQADGWYLRQDIIWHKPNPMPESVTDRCTKSHEYIFLLSKSSKYYYDADAIAEKATGYDGRKDLIMKGSEKYNVEIMPNQQIQTIAKRGHARWKNKDNDGDYIRNKRSVWTVNTKPFPEAHFAVFTGKLIEDCIKAGCPVGGIVLDPFIGSGTTGIVARKQDKNYIGIELNKEYVKMAQNRISKEL